MIFKKFFKVDDPKYWDSIQYASTIGLHMVSGVLVGLAVGWLIDNWLDSKPWGILIFLGFGIAAGFKNVYVDAKRLKKRQDEEDARKYAGKEHNRKD